MVCCQHTTQLAALPTPEQQQQQQQREGSASLAL